MGGQNQGSVSECCGKNLPEFYGYIKKKINALTIFDILTLWFTNP